MCDHEWDKYGKGITSSTRCIKCGWYLDKDGSITFDRPYIVKMNRLNKQNKPKRPKYK
ncbi:MAG: hypothetical protein K0R09_3580 [Clostridiales bacterium]|jgi:hypothetical protein|nr:hypothetical protein [Clostridiales bacterium]